MNRKLCAGVLLFTALLIFSGACAKISAPAGGARDRQPPVVVESIPQSRATNFKGKGLEISFNEYVVLDNISEKLMVSPPMKKKPTISIKGKSIVVVFEEKLKDSSTYTFYFQDAIKDLNEGNILEDYQFVFSTGPILDTLSVTGNVYNSFDLEIPEKTVVLMYRDLADSSVKKHFPDYISRLNLNGSFRINNVPKGSYKLYALKDADNSKSYNLEDEEFAFRSLPIEVTPEKNFIPEVKDTVKTIKIVKAVKAAKPAIKALASDTIPGEHKLILFKSLRKNHYLTGSSRDLPYKFVYTLSLPPDSSAFNFSIPGTNPESYLIEKTKDKDTISIWLTDSTLYSQPQISTIIRYPFTDTLGITGYKTDTINMRFLAPRTGKASKVKKPEYTVETNINAGTLKPGQIIVIKSKTPFKEADTSRIRVYETTDSTKIKIPYSLKKDSSDFARYFLKSKFIPGRKYLYIADSAAFGNIFNEITDSTGMKFSVREEDSYSKLTLNLQNYEGGRIIQLLDKSEKLVDEQYMKKDGKIVFPLLENGFYRVRAIYDIDGDGKWTTGDFSSGRQPEPVSYYPGEIEIKTGWEVEQDWDLSAQNSKIPKLLLKRKTK
jgi:hypothetical protein